MTEIDIEKCNMLMRCDCGSISDVVFVFHPRHQLERRVCRSCHNLSPTSYSAEVRTLTEEGVSITEFVHLGSSWDGLISSLTREKSTPKKGFLERVREAFNV